HAALLQLLGEGALAAPGDVGWAAGELPSCDGTFPTAPLRTGLAHFRGIRLSSQLFRTLVRRSGLRGCPCGNSRRPPGSSAFGPPCAFPSPPLVVGRLGRCLPVCEYGEPSR